MPTHTQYLCSVLFFATACAFITVIGLNGLSIEVGIFVSRIHYRNGQDEQVGQGVNDVVIKGGGRCVGPDQLDSSSEDYLISVLFFRHFFQLFPSRQVGAVSETGEKVSPPLVGPPHPNFNSAV